MESSRRVEITDREDLIDVFYETLEVAKANYFGATCNVVKGVKFYKGNMFDVVDIPHKRGNKVIFVDGGTANVAYAYAYGDSVAMLNFANGVHPGGCVEGGARAQEENLCRCSNLYFGLKSDVAKDNFYKVNSDNYNNGMCTDTVMYHKNVAVFRDDCTYDFKAKRNVDVITCPAPCCDLKGDKAVSVYYKRIKGIIMSAIDNNVEDIVLGAWGCGAFGQDPRLVAKAFALVLNDYGGYFKRVVFAFKGTSNEENTPKNIFNTVFDEHYKYGVKNL